MTESKRPAPAHDEADKQTPKHNTMGGTSRRSLLRIVGGAAVGGGLAVLGLNKIRQPQAGPPAKPTQRGEPGSSSTEISQTGKAEASTPSTELDPVTLLQPLSYAELQGNSDELVKAFVALYNTSINTYQLGDFQSPLRRGAETDHEYALARNEPYDKRLAEVLFAPGWETTDPADDAVAAADKQGLRALYDDLRESHAAVVELAVKTDPGFSDRNKDFYKSGIDQIGAVEVQAGSTPEKMAVHFSWRGWDNRDQNNATDFMADGADDEGNRRTGSYTLVFEKSGANYVLKRRPTE